MKIFEILSIVLAASSLGFVSGCNTSVAEEDPRVSEARSRLILKEEPSDALGVAEAKESVNAGDELTVVGRINAGEHRPWDDGRASFIICDAASVLLTSDSANEESHGHAHQHGEGHDHDNCPFCNKAKAMASSLAIVKFFDDDGEVVAIDARRLLSVRENQIVVVRGRGTIDPLGNLEIAADGIYIRE